MRKEWVAWLLFASLLLSGCGKTAQVPDEAQAAEEAVIQMETPTEEPAQASGILRSSRAVGKVRGNLRRVFFSEKTGGARWISCSQGRFCRWQTLIRMVCRS